MAKQKLSVKDARKRRLEAEIEVEAKERSHKKTNPTPNSTGYTMFEMCLPSKIATENVLHLRSSPSSATVAATPSTTPKEKDTGSGEERMSKLSQELQDFENAKSELMDYLLQREYHPMHLTTPTHWVRVWDPQARFFVKHDISTLREEGYSIPLGHSGQCCPHLPSPDKDSGMIVVDHNEVHQTRIHYCLCHGTPNHVQQLIAAGLFPATVRNPRTAFTLTVLRQFHIHHLESKESCFDFIGSLRHLTDDFFATATSDLYEQFLKVMRFWRTLMATKQLGQAHGIDKHFPQIRAGNLQVLCPACIQPGINTEDGWHKQQYPHLRHLNQVAYTADGNFHTSRYKKNCSSDDYSLFAGKAYYSAQADFKPYLRSLPVKDIEDKISCPIKAVTKQNQVVDNLAETGTVNIQCPHAIVVSTVDLQRRERFANTDYALARALHLHSDLCNPAKPYASNIDFLFSYDISCAYGVNISKRFEGRFPDLAPVIKWFQFLVPLVHIHNHKENCMYLYSSSYTECTGHLHGETAETEWPEVNQLVPQARQMNEGARQDIYITLHGDWNLKKVLNMATLLLASLIHARKLFLAKKEHFITLTMLYAHCVPEWNKRDRNVRIKNSSHEIECVFRHRTGKVPSQKKLYEGLFAIAKKNRLSTLLTTHSSISGETSEAIVGLKMVNEGLAIEQNQREILQAIKQLQACHTTSLLKPSEIADSSKYDLLSKTIDSSRTTLRRRLKKWKTLQTDLFGTFISDLRVAMQKGSSIDEPEHNLLFLPSYFAKHGMKTPLEGTKMDTLLRSECDLRKGHAFDAIWAVQDTAKTLSSLKGATPHVVNNYSARTCAEHLIANCENILELQIADYNGCHDALLALCGPDSTETQIFPRMTVDDTYRNPTHLRREIGSSTRMDGQMYNVGISAGVRVSMPSTLDFGHVPDTAGAASVVQTQGTSLSSPRKKKIVKERKGKARRINIKESAASQPVHTAEKKSKDHGWIWCLGAMRDLNEKDLQEWSDESNSVQWFRAEAEMR
ncbi:hypothetical protein CPC08DRAFT_729506 [Agrocybe pediades]|nr:hypothetical protein CPC08DRAFT_729506 [Agrocybe pediades]